MTKADDARPRRRRLLAKPTWFEALEVRIAERITVHPNVLSSVKLVLVLPPLLLALRPISILPPSSALPLVIAFFLLDWLDGVVARHRGLESRLAGTFDRLTDYPLLVIVCYLAAPLLRDGLLVAKIGLDLLLLALYALGRGSTDNRLRTALNYSTLLALLLLGQGWAPRIITPAAVESLLAVSIAFSATIALYNLGVLQKRFIADALSACNLLCGVFSIVFAARGRFEMSLLFIVLGAAFDGFDGAAARRFGGTRFGVYSDDIADGINYGIAPGVALYFAVDGGISGWVLGIFYPVFTIARLLFFTLDKASSDPNYFSGVPSPAGGLITMTSIVVFIDRPALLGLMVGIACAQMVSFSTHYRHVGRAIAKSRRALVGAPVYAVVLLVGTVVWGARGAASIILAGILVYGFLPTMVAFRRMLAVRKAARANRPPTQGGLVPASDVDTVDEDEPSPPHVAPRQA